MKTLSSNADLYEYLLALESNLRQHDLAELGDKVSSACRQASSTSTEFLGEARIALRAVSARGRVALTGAERTDLDDVLKQLDAALDGRR
jgi:hypothetical protein